MMKIMKYEWLSAYLFYNGSPELWLRTLIQPFLVDVQSRLHPVSPWFFIRYAEGGPHIRLRLQVIGYHLPDVKRTLENVSGQNNLRVQYTPYIRETVRYGNAVTITLAERQFYLSSQYSLQMISLQTNWDTTTALTAAFQLHIAFFHGLQTNEKTITGICERFIESWLVSLTKDKDRSFLTAIMEQMNELYNRQSKQLISGAMELWAALDGGTAPVALQAFADGNRSILQEYNQAGLRDDQLQYAYRSLLHMTHNRLGISNKEEPWCIFITYRCLKHIYENERRTTIDCC
jgi:thiopeptide-type bacteriocin biosynthesis protein